MEGRFLSKCTAFGTRNGVTVNFYSQKAKHTLQKSGGFRERERVGLPDNDSENSLKNFD